MHICIDVTLIACTDMRHFCDIFQGCIQVHYNMWLEIWYLKVRNCFIILLVCKLLGFHMLSSRNAVDTIEEENNVKRYPTDGFHVF